MDTNYVVHPVRTSANNFINYGYVIMDKFTREAVLVDPAWELEKFTDTIRKLEADVVAIVLTHSHFDHVNLVPSLLKLYNPDVYMSNEEINQYGYYCDNLQGLEDFDRIPFGRSSMTCLLTPGHTSGGMCFLLTDCMFTGDTIFIEGCGICHSEGGSAEQMFDSVQRVKKLAAPYVRVFPGHSFGIPPGLTMAQLMEINLYFQLDMKSYFVDFRMRKNQKNLFDFK